MKKLFILAVFSFVCFIFDAQAQEEITEEHYMYDTEESDPSDGYINNIGDNGGSISSQFQLRQGEDNT